MLQVLHTIVPVFAVILLGGAIRLGGFLPEGLMGPLNRLVYYLAIPAMIFREVAHAPFKAYFDPVVLWATLIPVALIFGVAAGAGFLFGIARSQMGTFLQSSLHGNLGYIGLAIAYYFLGKEGFTRASILAGFLMLLQNLLAVVGLLSFAGGFDPAHRVRFLFKKIFGNPIILSALAGILFSAVGLAIPEILDKTLGIVSGMSLPLALLVIGGSLSFDLVRSNLPTAVGSALLKLLLMPALGLLLYRWLRVDPAQSLAGLVLLAAPSATVTYVMATEMKGSPDLASAAVSLSTIASSATYAFWMGIFI
jgi:hypothetical protein